MNNIETMKLALEALEMYMTMDSVDEAHLLEVDIAPKAITALRQAIEQAQQAEPVAELTDDAIYDAAYATFCRGPNTRELFRMMWTCNPPCSIGWDRNELKAFARHIASLYTSPPSRQPLTDEEIEKIWGIHRDDDEHFDITYERDITRAIEAAHGIKEKNT